MNRTHERGNKLSRSVVISSWSNHIQESCVWEWPQANQVKIIEKFVKHSFSEPRLPRTNSAGIFIQGMSLPSLSTIGEELLMEVMGLCSRTDTRTASQPCRQTDRTTGRKDEQRDRLADRSKEQTDQQTDRQTDNLLPVNPLSRSRIILNFAVFWYLSFLQVLPQWHLYTLSWWQDLIWADKEDSWA